MRNNDLFGFSWAVPDGGFRWGSDEGSAGTPKRYLVPTGDWNSLEWRRSDPLRDDQALFRSFAELEATEVSVLAFANEHGQLVTQSEVETGTEQPGDFLERVRPTGSNPTFGSTMPDWVERVDEMKAAVSLWEAARSDDLESFTGLLELDGDLVRLQDDPIRIVVDRLELGAGEAPAELDELSRHVWTADDLVKRIANKCLVSTGVEPRLDDSANPDELFLRLIPRTLIGAMWVQFADWLQGGRSPSRCKECRRWFSVVLDIRGRRAEYCGDACRFKAYRSRKKSAVELLAAGRTIKEISEKLGSDTATVRKWIEEQRKLVADRKRRRRNRPRS